MGQLSEAPKVIPVMVLNTSEQYSTLSASSKLESHTKVVSFHIISRLSQYLEYQIPSNQEDLFPSYEWVWSSLYSQMKVIVRKYDC